MLRKLLIVAMFVGVAAGIIGLGSALFTSTATVDANQFTTGTVIISTNPTSALVTFANMAPADAVVAPLVVTNNGTLGLRYAVTSTVTNADSKNLASQLVLTIKTGVTACTVGGFGTDGTQIYSGALGDVAASSLIVGNPATGSDAGDRTLAASGTETLCFEVALPRATSNSYQGATTTATFAFIAEQTKNN